MVDCRDMVVLIAENGLSSRSRCVSLLFEWCRVVCALYHVKVLISHFSLYFTVTIIVYGIVQCGTMLRMTVKMLWLELSN